ncbi:erythroid differentiation-related factor 1 isoform X2 [Nematostella vectensis]|nr:erythroid differentiation-related factor 1 isoform X2 [Nematostella vectensis]
MKVHSTAIVKYTSFAPPVLPYWRLSQDTNLNIAPANWLRDGRFSDVLPQSRRPVDFSSFEIAHTFLDTIGDVDVISDAENIKKLLKMPHSKGEISIAVHRIGRTLLLDDLDLPGLLSYASQSGGFSNYKWLLDFYCEQSGIPKGADFRKKKNRNQARERDILSKFLHYSIQQSSEDPSRRPPYEQPATPPDVKPNISDPGGPVVVTEPEEEDALPEPKQRSPFQRNILWRFEDIHMLVGSNLPIFGGGKYPAVSLRLRDCDKPINVLTGLDYWLDNLMCNVPEVAMCYHVDGIVQYYELYKTEELPNLKDSTFSPQVVKDIAKNLLSFMKSNCTQEGHTYWLYKGNDSEVVKLYDLTSICEERDGNNYQNLFTVPVGMLFFRVAKNMMKQRRLNSREQGTVRLLLDNCLTLIEEHNFPEIVASANYLLSELYSPDNVHITPHESSGESQHSSKEDLTLGDCTEDNENTPPDESVNILDVRELSTPGMYQDEVKQMGSMLTGNVEQRCKAALSYIVKGLLCLKMAAASHDELHHGNSQASSQAPIPSTALSIRHVNKPEPSSPDPLPIAKPDIPGKNSLILIKPVKWKSKSTALLLRKAATVYHSLACVSNSNGKYGRGLRFCKLAFKCFEAQQRFADRTSTSSQDSAILRSVLCACADAYLMLAKCTEGLSMHGEDFKNLSSDDLALSESAGECVSGIPGTFYSKVEFIVSMERNFCTSVELYEAALDLMGKDTQEEEFVSIARRVGNVKNELGVHYMNCAAAELHREVPPTSAERDLWRKSISFFESGIRAFETIDDRANMALLYSNSGRLMRLCAQAVAGYGTTRGQFSQEERAFFNKAFELYNQALRTLAERRVCPGVWDTVTWELSGAYNSMAVLLQDYPPLSLVSHQQVEKEVTELMMKALKLCEPGPSKLPGKSQAPGDVERRVGTIHHRLASLYHNAYRNEVSDHLKKKQRSLAELHYAKACTYIRADVFPCEWMRILLERVAMCEHQLALHTGSSAAVKTLQVALGSLLEARKALVVLSTHGGRSSRTEKRSGSFESPDRVKGKEGALDAQQEVASGLTDNDSSLCEKGIRDIPVKEGVAEHVDEGELDVLVSILEARLNNALKELVKGLSQKGRGKGPEQTGLDKAKRMYSVALRATTQGSKGDVKAKANALAEALSAIDEIRNS